MHNPIKNLLEARRLEDEQRVLRALNRHPQEEFTAWEIGRLAYVGTGVYVTLMRLLDKGLVVDRWIMIESPGPIRMNVGKGIRGTIKGTEGKRPRRLYKLATGFER